MRRDRHGNRRGVALMLALWLVVVLGAIAAGTAALVRGEVDTVGNLRARSAARYAAESGVVVARARLEAVLAAHDDPGGRARAFTTLESRFTDLTEAALGPARFGVAVADLNARLDLNYAEPATLRNFLAQFTSDDEATRVAAAIEDWRDEDDVPRPGGAEAAAYERAGSPYVPANAPLDRLETLRRVLGVSDSLADAVAPHITVDGDGRINLNTAPYMVLSALPGIGPSGARELLSRRARGELFSSAAVVGEITRRGAGGAGAAEGAGVIDMSRTSTVPSRILVVSRGWQQGHPLTHEIQAVFAIAGTRLTLRAWRERDL